MFHVKWFFSYNSNRKHWESFFSLHLDGSLNASRFPCQSFRAEKQSTKNMLPKSTIFQWNYRRAKPNQMEFKANFSFRSFRSVGWTIDRLLFNCFVFVSLNDFLLIHFERKWKFHSFDCSALFAMAVPMLLLAVLPIPIFKVMLCSLKFLPFEIAWKMLEAIILRMLAWSALDNTSAKSRLKIRKKFCVMLQ